MIDLLLSQLFIHEKSYWGEDLLKKKDAIIVMTIVTLIFLLIGFSVNYYITDVRVTPIEDTVLRNDILEELNLLEYEDDESRPNKDD